HYHILKAASFDNVILMRGIETTHQTLTNRVDTHFTVYHKAQPAEHLFFFDPKVGDCGEIFSDPVSKFATVSQGGGKILMMYTCSADHFKFLSFLWLSVDDWH